LEGVLHGELGGHAVDHPRDRVRIDHGQLGPGALRGPRRVDQGVAGVLGAVEADQDAEVTASLRSACVGAHDSLPPGAPGADDGRPRGRVPSSLPRSYPRPSPAPATNVPAQRERGPKRGAGSGGATAAGSSSSRASASVTPRSSCGSSPLIQALGGNVTSMSGSTPWFSIDHSAPSNQVAYLGWVTAVPSTRSKRPSMPPTPPQVRMPITGPMGIACVAAPTMSPSEPASWLVTSTTAPRGANAG